MKLIFCCEAVFLSHKGNYYGSSAPYGMMLWNRYLEEFDSIEIIARVEEVETPTTHLLNKDKVKIHPLPRYKGLTGALKVTHYLKKELSKYANEGDAYILRVPGQIGTTFSKILHARGIRYGVEVAGDPWDVMGSIGGYLSFLLRRVGKYQLRYVVANSSIAMYVTKFTLQKRYPVKDMVKSYAVSDVIIPPKFFANKPHKLESVDHIPRLVAVGSLEQLYKAPDIVISALSNLINQGFQVRMKWLGGGRYMEAMKQLSYQLGVNEMIEFLGDVGRETVETELENADLFIHISRTEGLPRAIIEAMAKGLPVIGSKVGGIPELISESCLVAPDDAEEAAIKIKSILSDNKFYNTEAKTNLERALEYDDTVLSSIRSKYFNDLKALYKDLQL